jgi:uncharacterized membrane-anchored protein
MERAVGLPAALAAGLLLMAVALLVQFLTDGYAVWIYWVAVAATGLTGSLASSGQPADGELLGAWGASGLLAFAAAATAVRQLHAGSPSSPRRAGRALEAVHWLSALAAFVTGTAVARLADVVLPAGVALAPALLAALACGLVATRRLPGPAPSRYPWATCLTAPFLGVSLTQWLTAPLDEGGLGWGQFSVAVLLGVIGAGQLGRLADSEPAPPAD